MRYGILLVALLAGLVPEAAARTRGATQAAKSAQTCKCPLASSQARGISREDWERNDRAQALNLLLGASRR